MKRLILVGILVFVLMLSACREFVADDSKLVHYSEQAGSVEPTNHLEPTLILTEAPWTGWTKLQPEPTTNTFEGITEGTVVYNSDMYGKITVTSMNDSSIELKIEGLPYVERNKDEAQPLENLTILRGEETEIISKTMDAGISFTIRYE